jgi:hypothetical protein
LPASSFTSAVASAAPLTDDFFHRPCRSASAKSRACRTISSPHHHRYELIDAPTPDDFVPSTERLAPGVPEYGPPASATGVLMVTGGELTGMPPPASAALSVTMFAPGTLPPLPLA